MMVVKVTPVMLWVAVVQVTEYNDGNSDICGGVAATGDGGGGRTELW